MRDGGREVVSLVVTVDAFVSSFVGRAAERSALAQLISSARFVVVTGAGGIGKTRLAHAAVAAVDERFDHVVVCDVEGFDVDAVVAAVGDVADIDLLVLDNFEAAAVDARAAVVVHGWLARHPGLRVLITSRVRWRATGVQVFVVPPMTNDDARALLRERCAQLGGHAWLDDDDALTPLLHHLDGMPLAIEHAATWSPMLSPATYLSADAHGETLARAPHDVAPRHRDPGQLVAAMTSSVSPSARRTWLSSSLFESTFSFADLRAIDGADADDVAAIVDASLWQGSSTAFRLLLPLRARAVRERRALDAVTQDRWRAAWAAWAVDLDDRADPTRLVAREADLVAVIGDDDLRDQRTIARAALLLVRLARTRGPFSRVAEIVAAALTRVDLIELRAPLLLATADAALHDGDIDAAVAALDAVDIVGHEVDVFVLRGRIARARGDIDAAHRHLAAAIALSGGDQRARLSAQQAALNFEAGDSDVALRQFSRVLDDARGRGDAVTVGVTLTNMALVLQARGRFDDAARACNDALVVHRAAGHRRFEGITLGDIASLALERQHVATALTGYRAAIAVLDEVGDVRQALVLRAAARLCEALTGDGVDIVESDDDDALGLAARVFVDAADAVDAIVAGDDITATIAAWDARLTDVDADPRTARADEVRLALRIARGLRHRLERDEVLVIDDDGYRLRDGRLRSLRDKPLWLRLLRCLAHAAIDDEAVPASVLVDSGWPDEKMLAASASNRLAVALSGLRRHGFAGVLVLTDAGYRLRAVVMVQRSSA